MVGQRQNIVVAYKRTMLYRETVVHRFTVFWNVLFGHRFTVRKHSAFAEIELALYTVTITLVGCQHIFILLLRHPRVVGIGGITSQTIRIIRITSRPIPLQSHECVFGAGVDFKHDFLPAIDPHGLSGFIPQIPRQCVAGEIRH